MRAIVVAASERCGTSLDERLAPPLTVTEMMDRRAFLRRSALLTGSAPVLSRSVTALQRARAEAANGPEPRIRFDTSDARYQKTYAGALDVLARNTATVSRSRSATGIAAEPVRAVLAHVSGRKIDVLLPQNITKAV